jgi:endonuclease-3
LTDKERIAEIFRALQKARPAASLELEYTNPFTLLVAVILSAQARDVRVNAVTRTLFAQFSSPQELLSMGIRAFEEQVRTIGLYKTKSQHIFRLAEILLEQHAGLVPETREELERLPGVGRKTANVVRNVVFGHPVIAVDTHVFRVAHRLALSSAKTPTMVGEDLEQSVPSEYLPQAHHWLVLHGRYTCLARTPKCSTCIVQTWCFAEAKSEPAAPLRLGIRGHRC